MQQFDLQEILFQQQAKEPLSTLCVVENYLLVLYSTGELQVRL